MAFKPSARRTTEFAELGLDIRPVMNLMVVLIPLLLQGAEWVKLGAIEINAPPTKSVGNGADTGQQDNQEEQRKLGLKIAITHDGISIANAQTVLSSDNGEGPTVPKAADGSYDFDKLREKLIEVKKAIKGKGYTDENRAVITASSDIEYQTLVDLVDNIQTYQEEKGKDLPLFPEVNFGSILQ